MKKVIIFLIILPIAGCASIGKTEPTIDMLALEKTIMAEVNLTATANAPSETPEPTHTPEPTKTPEPTNTPKPTSTYTPVPEPLEFSGSGDSVIDIDKWDGAALLNITYKGTGNFAVWNYNADGEKIDLLVNTIGNYEGTRPLDFLDSEATTRLQIESSGQWSIQVLPIERIRREQVPGTFSGVGDDVILLEGSAPDLLKVDANDAQSNFVIWSYGNTLDLLVNEIAPYNGTVVFNPGAFVLAVEAEGNWALEVTAK